ncbi:ABC transporter substrate-binding protein [Virgibacillus alimentarius]|uniref:ABC transporter substrate-binding protein n=1 Tax=Virgibacillus alimentarius TaxID=698769 RepID=UPI00049341C3|nr:ABC transporter substrate-binding protein [Virgibacillus alimentarius]HLQ95200.1 ABC transporter substrate-binding protein [Pseudogracilibacillus sp.]
MKKSVLSFLILALSLVFVGCSGDDSGSGEAKETKGSIDVYTHNDSEEMQDFVKGLKEETGIEANVLRLSSGEGWSRMKSEAPDFGADMQWGMLHSIALKAEKEGFLEPYDSPTWEDVPDEFKDEDGKWYGWSYWFNLLAINTEILEEKGLDKPESWEDLLDPQYKGEIVLPDPGTSGTAYLFVSTIMQILGEEEGWEYFEKLDENVGQYAKSGDAPAQMTAQGEYAIGITWDQAVYNRIEEGYPLETVIPEEGVGYDLDVVWMFKDTENRALVEEAIDYIGSEGGMKKSAEHRSMVTKNGVKGNADDIEQYLIDYDAVWAEENRERIMKEWRERF